MGKKYLDISLTSKPKKVKCVCVEGGVVTSEQAGSVGMARLNWLNCIGGMLLEGQQSCAFKRTGRHNNCTCRSRFLVSFDVFLCLQLGSQPLVYC